MGRRADLPRRGTENDPSRKGGRIIIISSILSSIAEPGSTHYAMSKSALNQLGRQLAVEWAEHGILVNVVAPGCVHTPMSYVTGSNEFESEWFKAVLHRSGASSPPIDAARQT